MTNEEKLIRTRNLVRHILKTLGNEIDVKSRNNHEFFFDLMGRCTEVGIIEEDCGLFRLTEKEEETGHREGARHRGGGALRVKNLLYYRKEDQGVETRPEGS